MNSLGIYFGPKDINITEVNKKKIINSIRLPHLETLMAEVEEKVPADIKLIAMFKDAFRTYRINAQDASFCLSGTDLVIRTFEIPMIPQSELRGVVNFEIKKYIPFKLEELDYDFRVLFNRKNKTNLILFVGIKKEILDKYILISKQLNLKISTLEYSAFSILRFLKLSGINESGIIASLCFDLNNEDEVNFTVFENGFSLFSRDFVLSGEPQGFEQAQDADRLEKLDKLKNEIRASVDYYKRKFPDKDIKNIYIVSDNEYRQELSSFSTESPIPVKFVEAQKVLGKQSAYSSMLLKSYSAASFREAPLKISLDLVGQKLKAARTASLGVQPLALLLEGLKLDLRFLLVSIVICASIFVYGLMRIQPVQLEISEITNKRLKLSPTLEGQSIEELSAKGASYKTKIKALDNLVKNQVYATYPFDAIPAALPGGVWLNDYNFTQKPNGSIELVISGKAYLGSNEKELEAVNLFFTNLRNDKEFARYFREISITSIDRITVKDISAVNFIILCKGSPEKK